MMPRFVMNSAVYVACHAAMFVSTLYAFFGAHIDAVHAGSNAWLSAVLTAGRPKRSICVPSVGAAGGLNASGPPPPVSPIEPSKPGPVLLSPHEMQSAAMATSLIMVFISH